MNLVVTKKDDNWQINVMLKTIDADTTSPKMEAGEMGILWFLNLLVTGPVMAQWVVRNSTLATTIHQGVIGHLLLTVGPSGSTGP